MVGSAVWWMVCRLLWVVGLMWLAGLLLVSQVLVLLAVWVLVEGSVSVSSVELVPAESEGRKVGPRR